MPAMRRRAPPAGHTLRLDLPVAASSAGAAALLSAFVQHLAFAREQCHAPFAQLDAHVMACREAQRDAKATGRAVRLKASSRRAIKAAASIPLGALRGGAVALLLGSSALRPREVYCLRFPAAMDAPGAPPPSEQALGAACRQLLRALVMEQAGMAEWDESPGPTKMFLLFAAPEGSLAAPPQGFAPKRAFALNMRKALQARARRGRGPAPPRSAAAGAAAGPADARLPVAARGCGAAQVTLDLRGDAQEGELQQLSQAMSAQMRLQEPAGAQQGGAAVAAAPAPALGAGAQQGGAAAAAAAAPALWGGACAGQQGGAPPLVWYQCAAHAKGLRPGG
ncbi:hypothetical protein HT031_003653 [Scenedesmus sp. PABB004]|nr:hypothetical protein HT031_003653 [Scenedesmus sp. PABB004]